MGIHKLNDIIKKYAPNSIKKVYIKDILKGKKIAVDIATYIFKYKAVFGQYWLNSFINLFYIFKKYDIKSIIVFDNKNKIIEKKQENDKRKETRKKLLQKIKDVEESIIKYNEEGIITETLKNINNKSSSEKLKRLLTNFNIEEQINIQNCEKELENLKSQVINITDDDIHVLKELCENSGLDYVTSISEAEGTCSYLNKIGIVDFVLSEDTDVLVHGCKHSISKINIGEETVNYIILQNLLEEIDMSRKTFVDFCILLGCDFNKSIKGIGPERSFKLIKKYRSIEDIETNISLDISSLKHIRTREIFNTDIKFILNIDKNEAKQEEIQNNTFEEYEEKGDIIEEIIEIDEEIFDAMENIIEKIIKKEQKEEENEKLVNIYKKMFFKKDINNEKLGEFLFKKNINFKRF
jgi:flap endonuclease-1